MQQSNDKPERPWDQLDVETQESFGRFAEELARDVAAKGLANAAVLPSDLPAVASANGNVDEFSFLAIFRGATLRFDAPVIECETLERELGQRFGADFKGMDEVRSAARETLRRGFLDEDHQDPVRAQLLGQTLIWLCMTSPTRLVNPDARGFVVEITEDAYGDANFRFALAPGKQDVDEFTAKVRKGRKHVIRITPEQAAKAMARKRTPPPRDPNLEPPPRPRPERWLEALEAGEKRIGKPALLDVRTCLETGACFVWRSRQLADTAQEELHASLGALAEWGRLRLPFPHVWAETREWIDTPNGDGPMGRVEARLAIAAWETSQGIQFNGFADVNDERYLSLTPATLDVEDLIASQDSPMMGRSFVRIDRPPTSPGPGWDESKDRRVARACGERLMELLFLLSAAGVARENVRQGQGGNKHGQKKHKAQRRLSDRDYTIVRVPLVYQPDTGGSAGGGNSGGGRWVRPHVRRAHTWGKYTRPVEEQRQVEACLVGADKVEKGEVVRRPEYRVV